MMDELSDYLSRPVIKGIVFEISEDRISIQNPGTSFIMARLDPPLEKAALLEQYQRVLRQAKAKRVRISYTAHIRKTICENWEEYEKAVHEKQRLFQQMMALAYTVKERGIHLGWRDDAELEHLCQLQYQFQSYGWGGSAASRINSAACHLRETEAGLSAGSGRADMISL